MPITNDNYVVKNRTSHTTVTVLSDRTIIIITVVYQLSPLAADHYLQVHKVFQQLLILLIMTLFKYLRQKITLSSKLNMKNLDLKHPR